MQFLFDLAKYVIVFEEFDPVYKTTFIGLNLAVRQQHRTR